MSITNKQNAPRMRVLRLVIDMPTYDNITRYQDTTNIYEEVLQ